MKPSINLEALRPVPGCLSALKISQMAHGESLAEGATEHVATCDVCRTKLADERAHVAAMGQVRVPQAVLQAARTPRWQVWNINWAWLGLVAPVAAAVLFVQMPRAPQEGLSPVLVKGGVALSVSVTRGDSTVIEDAPFESVHDVHAGDKLHLRVVAPLNRWIVVQGREGQGWVDYFAGPRPNDGWLPVTVAVTDGSKSELRVMSCDSEADAQGNGEACENKTYTF